MCQIGIGKCGNEMEATSLVIDKTTKAILGTLPILITIFKLKPTNSAKQYKNSVLGDYIDKLLDTT